MNTKSLSDVHRDEKPDLTPMIDVTFLLLVFFLFTIRFKVLEGVLQTALPKDAGVSFAPAKMLETADLVVARTDDQLSLALNGQNVPDLPTLGTRLQDLRTRLPARDGDDPLHLKIDAREGVLHQDVVTIVDRALAAQIHHVLFR